MRQITPEEYERETREWQERCAENQREHELHISTMLAQVKMQEVVKQADRRERIATAVLSGLMSRTQWFNDPRRAARQARWTAELLIEELDSGG